MKYYIVVFYLIVGFMANAQTSEIDRIRDLYFDEWTGKCEAEELVSYMETIAAEQNEMFSAYKGAAIATTANCESMPWNKLKNFNMGKKYLELAVQSEPQNIEIRFIRFTIQSNIPGILNYDIIAEDKDFILIKLNLHTSLELEKKMLTRMYNYLRNSDELSIEDKNKLDLLMVKG